MRRQWKALGGFVGAVAALGLLAVGMFGWDGVWFYATTVMVRAINGSVIDPYNPGWASMTALLRRTLLSEAELNPHPAWQAPAAFFPLRTAYAIGLLVVSMVGLARNHQDREAQAIGWFVVALFVLSPNEASYHFILLLVAVTLLLPGMSRRWAAGPLILYVLAELPLFPWDARFFPKAWLVLSLFFYGGWHFLRQIGRVHLGATVLAAAAVGSADAVLRLPAYWREPPQANPHVVVDAASVYSSAPVFGSNGWMYEAMGRGRYVLRRLAATKIQTFAFNGDAFHPAQSQREGPVFLEVVHNGVSQFERFDLKTYSLNPALGTERNSTEPALSPDGGKLAFVADGGLYLYEGGRRTILAPGLVVDPAFYGWKSDRVCARSARAALHRGDLDTRWRDTNPGRGSGLLRASCFAGWAPAGICLFGDRRASGLGARSDVRSCPAINERLLQQRSASLGPGLSVDWFCQ